MAEPGKFFCHSCQRWHVDAVKVSAGGRRPVCESCFKKAELNANQSTVVRALNRGNITQAHIIQGERNKRLKERERGGKYGKWPD